MPHQGFSLLKGPCSGRPVSCPRLLFLAALRRWDWFLTDHTPFLRSDGVYFYDGTRRSAAMFCANWVTYTFAVPPIDSVPLHPLFRAWITNDWRLIIPTAGLGRDDWFIGVGDLQACARGCREVQQDTVRGSCPGRVARVERTWRWCVCL